MPRHTKQQQQEAKERLKKWLPKGSTIYTIVRQVSRSGMSRNIQLIYFQDGQSQPNDRHPTYSVAQALNVACHSNGGHDTIRVNGCGADMCWSLVNEQLSYTLWGTPGEYTVRNL